MTREIYIHSATSGEIYTLATDNLLAPLPFPFNNQSTDSTENANVD